MNINLRIEVTHSETTWENICELLRAGFYYQIRCHVPGEESRDP